MDRSTGGNHVRTRRLRLTFLVVPVLLVVFVARLFQLQVLEGAYYAERARDNREDVVSVPAPRGVVYDRNGMLLVRNVPQFNVVITPALLPDSYAEVQAIYRRLSALTGVPAQLEREVVLPGQGCPEEEYGIQQFVEEAASIAPYRPWPVACDVDEQTARILREEQVDLPGVSVVAVPVRDYPTGELTAAIIGLLGPIPETLKERFTQLGFRPERDRVGYGGLEYQYQDELAGRNGEQTVEVDVAGQTLRLIGEVVPVQPGYSLRLSIDTRLQAAAEAALLNRMDFLDRLAGEKRTSIGAVIAMNPQTGEILAMVSVPTLDNQRLARSAPVEYGEYIAELESDPRSPLVNHAIGSTFPPGSTFKLATAVGALNEGVVTPEQRIFDPGTITIANRYYPTDPGRAKEFFCWEPGGHEWVNMLRGITVSCNIFFYKVGGGYEQEVPGDGLGIDRIGIYARALGYGSALGIDLPGELAGLIPSPDWKRINLGESWSTGDTYNAATGQGFVLATPLQVLTSVATLGNGGRVMWPHIVTDILDGEGNVVQHFEPRVLWDISDGVLTPGTPDALVEPRVIRLVQEGMRGVVANEEGTAYKYARIGVADPDLDLELIPSAGKTGTGEFCDARALAQDRCIPGRWPTHAWYAAYAPYENPEIAVVAFVYNGGEGAVTSGPIVRQVLETYFALKAIDAARSP